MPLLLRCCLLAFLVLSDYARSDVPAETIHLRPTGSQLGKDGAREYGGRFAVDISSADDLLYAMEPAGHRRLQAGRSHYQPVTKGFLPFNVLGGLLNPLDSVMSLVKNPLAGVSSLITSPFSLLTDPNVEQHGPPPLGDILTDLSLASISSQAVYQALSAFQSIFALPATLFVDTVGTLAGLSTNSTDFRSLGVLGIGPMAEGLSHQVHHQHLLSGFAMNSTFLPVSQFIQRHQQTADALPGDIDVLTMLLSGGLMNPIMVGLKSINAAVNLILQAPMDALSWLGLTKSLTNTQDSLRRLDDKWVLTDDQRSAVHDSVAESQGLLDFIGGHTGNIGVPFLSEVSKRLNKFATSILRLNGTALTPKMNYQDLDVSNLVTPPTESLIKFILTPVSFLSSSFGLPLEVAQELGKVPFDLVGLPLYNITDLNPLSLVTSFRDTLVQATDISRLLSVLQGLFQSSTSMLQGIPGGLNSQDGPLGFMKLLSLDNALHSAVSLTSSLAQTPLSLLDALNPLSSKKGSSSFGGPLSSLLGGIEGRRLEGATPHLGQQQHHHLPAKQHNLKQHPLEHHAPSRLLVHHGDQVYQAHLVADHNALKTTAAHLHLQRDVVCDPTTAVKHEAAKARLLVGNPKRLLAEAGVTEKAAHDALAGKTSNSPKTQHASVDDSVTLCEIKKQGADAVRHLAEKLDALAAVIGRLAHATTVHEAQAAQQALHTDLLGLDVPLPPTETL